MEKDLQCLKHLGIIEKVEPSQWASLRVAVGKEKMLERSRFAETKSREE